MITPTGPVYEEDVGKYISYLSYGELHYGVVLKIDDRYLYFLNTKTEDVFITTNRSVWPSSTKELSGAELKLAKEKLDELKVKLL